MIFFLFFFSCTIKPDFSLLSVSKISYPDLIEKYNSCEGKGYVDSQGDVSGKLYFSFKSQRDSTFIEFSDFMGRKTILMWVDPKKFTVRDLINNKYYKKSLKKYKKDINNSIDLRFSRKNFQNEKYALSTLYYEDKKSGDAFEVAFKSRHRNNDYINIRKLWKMLEF